MSASSRASTVVLLVTASTAIGAFLRWPHAVHQPPQPSPKNAAAIELAQSALTCPALREAPAPRVLDGVASECPVIEEVKAALKKEDTAITEQELVKLRTSVEQAVATRPAACVSALALLLEKTTACDLIFDAVAIRILNGKSVSPAMAAGALLRPSTCQWKLVSALREAERADPTIIAAVASLTTSADEDVRGSSWLILGTLERIAREKQQNELVSCVDDLLATKIANRTDHERFIYVRAAGNAGCEKCRPSLVEDVNSTDADVRRESITSFRFLSTKADVDVLCKTLATDKQKEVRESAAFALRQRDTFLEQRLGCLFEAAVRDEAASVANNAVLSINEFAANSKVALGTLVQVAKHSHHESIRKQTTSSLRAYASEDAIRDVMKAP